MLIQMITHGSALREYLSTNSLQACGKIVGDRLVNMKENVNRQTTAMEKGLRCNANQMETPVKAMI